MTLTNNCFVWFVTSPANFKALKNPKLVPETQEIRLGQELLARALSKKLAKRVICKKIRHLTINPFSSRIDLCKASRHVSLGRAVGYGQGRSKIAVINGRKDAWSFLDTEGPKD